MQEYITLPLFGDMVYHSQFDYLL